MLCVCVCVYAFHKPNTYPTKNDWYLSGKKQVICHSTSFDSIELHLQIYNNGRKTQILGYLKNRFLNLKLNIHSMFMEEKKYSLIIVHQIFLVSKTTSNDYAYFNFSTHYQGVESKQNRILASCIGA